MKNRFLTVSILSCVFGFGAIPSTAQAGPLLDWVFQRNRSQGLAATTANYPGSYQTNSGSGCCLTSGLLGRNRRTSNFAPQSNSNATTAGYSPQGTCGPGWCQQTVVRYVPQVAYRTAYQPVPVTTYKTSTTINPANGLPRTCTRPCTTYSYQARRVPYTTYRPVYTTVPVNDDFGQPFRTALAPTNGSGVAPNYALQPLSGGCSSCQTRSPGYTPGYANNLPPAPRGGAWSNSPLSPSGLGQPTPWQSTNPGYGTSRDPSLSYGNGGDSAGATPWRPLSERGSSSAPGGANTEADSPPRLSPDYSDRYYSNYPDTNGQRLRPVPMPESVRNRLRGRTGSSFHPNNRIDDSDDNDQARRGLNNDSLEQRRHFRQDAESLRESLAAAQEQVFSTPEPSGIDNFRSQGPTLEAPANNDAFEVNETRRQRFDVRGVQDLNRGPRSLKTSVPNRQDKTASRGTRNRGTMPLLEDDTARASRYPTVPIDWGQLQQPASRMLPQSKRASLWQVR